MTPEKALNFLKEGNKRFLEKKVKNHDHHQQILETKDGQSPFAVVLGCIDSRVPHEYVFDLGFGDVFSIRIAGNILNEDIIGSMEFACKVTKAKHILVLGHSGCGAIAGAHEEIKLGKLTALLEKIRPAIDAVGDGSKTADPDKLNDIARKNVELVTRKITQESEVLRELFANKEIGISGAMYNVESGKVEFL